jgi:hypothetical protein
MMLKSLRVWVTRRVTRTHAGMGMGINLYPLADMGNPTGLFFCRGYGYGIMIPGGYLPIAISNSKGSGGGDSSAAVENVNKFEVTKVNNKVKSY